jgi:protein-S-isoprenylcysteine O-methyltransferase Ste14
MDDTSFIVTLTAQCFIGSLPIIFFRKEGSVNLRFWLTGLPFFVSAFALIAARFDLLPTLPTLPMLGMAWKSRPVVAALLGMAGVGIMCWTIGSHRVPLARWHEEDDAPVSIVTWGPYRYVRHPFYVAFQITQIAALLLLPHPATFLGLLYALLALAVTARREERRLLGSEFGTEYRDYMRKTGRFVPGLGRLAQ